MNLIKVSFALISVFVMGPWVSCLDQEQILAINTLIESQFLPLNSAPGLGLSIVHGDDSLATGYGYRDLEKGLPATSSTYFAIASISKSFTALVVLRVLATTFPELRESVLDVPIRQLIPSYNFMSIDRYRSENMNMRDLLSHRACTRSDYLGLDVGPYKTKAEYVYRQRYSASICPVRSAFVYNNGLIQEAGEIAAAIAGTTFEALLEQLFEDIGLHQTTFVRETDDLDNMTLLSRPYYREDGVLKPSTMELLKKWTFVAPGSGGILTTPAEFVKYLRFHLNGGRIGSEQIVPEEVMKWMHKVSNPMQGLTFRATDNDYIHGDIGYGLGLYVGTHKGYQRLDHGGYIGTYLSLVTMLPALNIGIFTTVNGHGTAHSEMSHGALHMRILNILIDGANSTNAVDPKLKSLSLEVETSPAQFSRSKSDKNAQIGPDSSPSNAHAPGVYGHPTSGEFTVTQHNETTLYINYGFFRAFLLQRGATPVYDVAWDSNFPHILLADYGYIPPVFVDFTDPLVAYLSIAGGRTPFEKDATLDTLPVQPWAPGSC